MSSNDAILVQQAFEDYKNSFSGEPISESTLFEVFAIDNLLKDYDLSYAEIFDGITDGGGDGGIDAVYMFINGELVSEDTELSHYRKDIHLEFVFFQAKCASSFKEDPIDKISSSFRDLFDFGKNDLSDLKTVYNERIIEKFALIRTTYRKLSSKFPSLEFRVFYTTNSPEKPHDNVTRKVDALKKDIRENYFSEASPSFDFIDANDLLTSIRKNQRTNLELQYVSSPLISPYGSSYICLVNIKDFIDFINDDKGKLRKSIFEANVRDYQGNAQVNQQIRDTLTENNKDDFWWLNNGITILTTRSSIVNNSLLIESPQIVNGLQTSTEISYYAQKANLSDEKRNVLVRVITSSDDESRNRIIKATNSQTDMPYASLRATDKIHMDIEDYFFSNGFYYDRRKNFYKNEGKPAKKIISISKLAQTVITTALQRPNDARARPTTLLKDDVNYQSIFSSDYHLDMYLNSLLLCDKIDFYLQTISDKKARLNCRFYALMLLTMKACGSDKTDPKKIASIDIESIHNEDVAACVVFVLSLYASLGGDDNVAKGKLLVSNLKKAAPEFLKLDSKTVLDAAAKTTQLPPEEDKVAQQPSLP